MYIKNLRLISEKEKNIIRNVNFHVGTNFIVDEEYSESHNHVGKTTFLKLIDIALGSKDKAFLYTDIQTGTKNIKLQKVIEEEKIFVELNLISKTKKNQVGKTVCLRVDLYNNGHKYINGGRKKAKEYNKELNKILFNNKKNFPTFRELIPYFVRVSAKKDNYNFLRNLHSNTRNTTYRAIYNYLFNISDSNVDIAELEKNREELDQFKKSEKNYRKLDNNNQGNDILLQKINSNKERKGTLELQLNDLVNEKDFEHNRAEFLKVRNKYMELQNHLDNIHYKLMLIDNDIEEAYTEEFKIDKKLTQELFNEVSAYMPQVSKTFEELIQFNIALKQNKLNYLQNLKEDFEKKKGEEEKKISKFLVENKDIISLVKNNNINKYEELNTELLEVNKNLIKQEEILNTLKNYSEKEKELELKIQKLCKKVDDKSNDFKKYLEIFNSYFTSFVSEIGQGNPILAYHTNIKEFPVSIEDLDEGTSLGTLKSLIMCYDIAYQEFAKAIKKEVPNFVVHDVLESISGDTLSIIINKINSLDIQVIVAILKEKLNSSNISKEDQRKYTILSLSQRNRVFDSAEKKFLENDEDH